VVVQARRIGNTVVVVPGTTQQGAARFDTAVVVDPSASNGLDAQTVFLPFQIRAIDGSRLVRQCGRLCAEDMAAIDDALRLLLEL